MSSHACPNIIIRIQVCRNLYLHHVTSFYVICRKEQSKNEIKRKIKERPQQALRNILNFTNGVVFFIISLPYHYNIYIEIQTAFWKILKTELAHAKSVCWFVLSLWRDEVIDRGITRDGEQIIKQNLNMLLQNREVEWWNY